MKCVVVTDEDLRRYREQLQQLGRSLPGKSFSQPQSAPGICNHTLHVGEPHTTWTRDGNTFNCIVCGRFYGRVREKTENRKGKPIQ